MIIDGVTKASFDELVEIETNEGERRLGKVLEVGGGKAVVQVFEGTTGLAITGTRVKFLGKTMVMPVSQELLGRVFDGLGRPNDGLPDPVADKFLDVNGEPMNPQSREYPTSFIQTGVSVIDGMLTLVRGQKLPIFSGSGMSHNILAAQIARQASVVGTNEDKIRRTDGMRAQGSGHAPAAGVSYVSFQRRTTRVSRSYPSTLTLPVERNRRPPKRTGSSSQRAPSARRMWPWAKIATSPSTARISSMTRSHRAETSAGVSPFGTPSRHRYQSGWSSRISGVVMPS